MADLVWKMTDPVKISPDDELSMTRVMNWILSRAIAQTIVEVAADMDEPVRLQLVVGDHEPVEFTRVHIRRESLKGHES